MLDIASAYEKNLCAQCESHVDYALDFRTQEAQRNYDLLALCQKCQDKHFDEGRPDGRH